MKFWRKINDFQKNLKKDTQEIKSDKRVMIKGDKSTNFYCLEGEKYKELLAKEVHKEYKKASQKEIKESVDNQKEIVSALELEDRVSATAKLQCFATLKDHKQNFEANPQVRLINPTKNDVGKISKQDLEKVNKEIREKTNLNQWTSNNVPLM